MQVCKMLKYNSLYFYFFFSVRKNKEVNDVSEWLNKTISKILKLTASVCMGWTANNNAAKKLVNSFRNILHTL